MRYITPKHIIQKMVRTNFYVTFSDAKEFLSMYVLHLNIGLKIFVIRCNVYGAHGTVFVEKVTVNCTHNPLWDLDRLMREGQ